jgi:electron transfer flavoprotein beta subunit
VAPLRPPTRLVRPPVGDEARDRILQLTGALQDRTPPRTIEVAPDEAADAILDQLRTWGYLE